MMESMLMPPERQKAAAGLAKEVVKKAGIDNFVYHDLRRTACSWLFEFKNLSVPEVQLMSGHRDPRVLLNIYTKLDPQKLVEKLA